MMHDMLVRPLVFRTDYMKKIIFTAFVALSACSSLNDAQGQCSAQNADYSLMWKCISDRVAAGNAGSMNNEMGIRYMAYGDVLDAEYRAGNITSEQAKLLLSDALVKANADFNEARGGGSVLGAVGQGLQAYGQSMQNQNQRVTCTTHYNTTYCN